MKTITRILSIALFTGLTSTAQAGQLEIDNIEAAASNLDSSALITLTNEYTDYNLAYAQYKLAVTASVNKNEANTLKALNASINTLEQLQAIRPNDVEVLALLAQVYGYKAGLHPFKAMYYGSKSNQALKQAINIDANNPRVLLVKGVIKANTPALFGGSNEQAKAAFDRSIIAFSGDIGSDYHWGYADAYTWRGIIHKNSGDIALAKVDWQQALNINPDFGWAKTLLKESSAK